MLPRRRTSFVAYLAEDVRRRHEHVRIGNDVVSFMIQIETLRGNGWVPVVRYDTAHGFAHRDLIDASGRSDKIPLFTQTLGEALDFAEGDLKTNWRSYLERFLRGDRQ